MRVKIKDVVTPHNKVHRTVSVNVRLTPEEFERLQRLAHGRSVSASAVLRLCFLESTEVGLADQLLQLEKRVQSLENSNPSTMTH